MRGAIEQAYQRFGNLHGVIHGAGVVGENGYREIKDSNYDNCDSHFQAKAHGLLVDRKSTRLNSSHSQISYAVFCLKKKQTCVEQSLLVLRLRDESDESDPDAQVPEGPEETQGLEQRDRGAHVLCRILARDEDPRDT